MIYGKKVVVVMPAYNAGKTLIKTFKEIPRDIVDDILLTDDASNDDTVKIAKKLDIKIIIHKTNKGYGANQKTCYMEALRQNSDIIIMLHPDYQYTPKLIPAMALMISSGEYDVVFASRILGRGALKGGMPIYKYVANRILTFIENLIIGEKLTEYHSGYRAFSSDSLKNIPFLKNSDDFVFDNQIISQLFYFGYKIGEISCPTRYFPEASSINFKRSIKYGFGVLSNTFRTFFHKINIKKYPILVKD